MYNMQKRVTNAMKKNGTYGLRNGAWWITI